MIDLTEWRSTFLHEYAGPAMRIGILWVPESEKFYLASPFWGRLVDLCRGNGNRWFAPHRLWQILPDNMLSILNIYRETGMHLMRQTRLRPAGSAKPELDGVNLYNPYSKSGERISLDMETLFDVTRQGTYLVGRPYPNVLARGVELYQTSDTTHPGKVGLFVENAEAGSSLSRGFLPLDDLFIAYTKQPDSANWLCNQRTPSREWAVGENAPEDVPNRLVPRGAIPERTSHTRRGTVPARASSAVKRNRI